MPDNGASMNLAQTFTPPADIRHDTSLVDGWRFIKSNVTGAEQESFDDQSWAVVSIPHTWNALDGQDGGNDYYRGPASTAVISLSMQVKRVADCSSTSMASTR